MGRTSGLTLIELIVVIAVIGILSSVAVPRFREFIQNSRTTTATNQLVTAINVARSEAIKRGQTARVCASSDQTACNSSDWTDGWIVETDTAAGPSEVVRVWEALPASANVTESSSADRIVFNARGAADDPRDFTLWFDDCTGEAQREIDINAPGRPAVATASCP